MNASSASGLCASVIVPSARRGGRSFDAFPAPAVLLTAGVDSATAAAAGAALAAAAASTGSAVAFADAFPAGFFATTFAGAFAATFGAAIFAGFGFLASGGAALDAFLTTGDPSF